MEFMQIAFPIIFVGIFVLSFGIVIANFVREILQWNKNNRSPRLTVEAKVVAKRTHVSHRRSSSHSVRRSVTSYFATFEVESGDRFELALAATEYGMLVEGDQGRLSFQGTRFLGFERT